MQASLIVWVGRWGLVWAVVALLAGAASAEPVAMVELIPTAAEFGTEPYPDENLRPHVQARAAGPGTFDTGVWYSGNWFWPEAMKIVAAAKELPADYDPASYRSRATDLFLVSREPKTGVGLWVQVTMMYHRLTYAVPAGATRFSAQVYRTDDSRGYVPDWADYPGWYSATLTVSVDGQTVQELPLQRVVVPMGSGELLGTIDVALPAGAQAITFQLMADSNIDWTKNLELVLHDGLFE